MDILNEKEMQLEKAIRNKEVKESLKLVLEMVACCAQKKDFQKAEYFRDMLYDIDPMALTEIIRANEILEEEKATGINSNHHDLWSKLYNSLTPEEANILYYALVETALPADHFVVRQGESCSSLYFVNSGELRAISKLGGREILIKMLKPGDFFGEDTFFSNSLCTASFVTLSPSTLGRLDKAVLKKWSSQSPGLEAKLNDFCLKEESIPELLHKKGIDRRTQLRGKISGKAAIQFLGNSGELIGKPFWGGLFDVSSGGISFLFRMSNAEKANLLLGRKLVLQISAPISETPFKLQKKGDIVAVCPQPFEDFSFHIKFDADLPKDIVETILQRFSPKQFP